MNKPKWWTSDSWATPPEFVHSLEVEFGRFNLDPCCRKETAKAARFYTEADDGLSQHWNGRVFLNPPYSNVKGWLAKAIQETAAGRAKVVVALLPSSSTDTRWFHECVVPHAEVRFIKGRVKWIGWEGTPIQSRHPSLLAIYRSPR